jgi:hypothetical protein
MGGCRGHTLFDHPTDIMLHFAKHGSNHVTDDPRIVTFCMERVGNQPLSQHTGLTGYGGTATVPSFRQLLREDNHESSRQQPTAVRSPHAITHADCRGYLSCDLWSARAAPTSQIYSVTDLQPGVSQQAALKVFFLLWFLVGAGRARRPAPPPWPPPGPPGPPGPFQSPWSPPVPGRCRENGACKGPM